MTIEQVKEEAKKRFDRDLTDQEAQAWLDAHPSGELQDEELADVAGGGCGSSKLTCPKCGSSNIRYTEVMGELYNCTCRNCGHELGL